MNAVFITASGTGIGKTLVTAALAWQLARTGRDVLALKPVISGFDEADMETSDTGMLLKSLGREVTIENVAQISPWRLQAALSPDIAARMERKIFSADDVLRYCMRKSLKSHDWVLVEGTGGVMTPLDDRHTMLDVIAGTKYPTVLVGGSYLGSLSHTLTALEVLRARDVPVRSVIISTSHDDTVPMKETLASLAHFTGPDIPLLSIPRLPDSDTPWQGAPNLLPALGL